MELFFLAIEFRCLRIPSNKSTGYSAQPLQCAKHTVSSKYKRQQAPTAGPLKVFFRELQMRSTSSPLMVPYTLHLLKHIRRGSFHNLRPSCIRQVVMHVEQYAGPTTSTSGHVLALSESQTRGVVPRGDTSH